MEQRYDKILQNVVRDFEEYESTIKVHKDNVYDVPPEDTGLKKCERHQEVGSEEVRIGSRRRGGCHFCPSTMYTEAQ